MGVDNVVRDNDGRKLDHNTLEAIRIRAVRQVEAGDRPDDIAASLGLSRSAVFSWAAAYRAGGLDALRAKPVPGRPSKLSDAQLAKLYVVLVGSHPEQHQLNCTLWTRAVVREVIRSHFGVESSDVSVGRWLRRIGLSSQRAPHRANQDEPEQVRRWRTETYPHIRTAAAHEGAAVYFVDEAALDPSGHTDPSSTHRRTPLSTTSEAATMITATTPKGMLRFAIFQGMSNPDFYVTFYKRLLSCESQRVFVITENNPAHRCPSVANFVTATDGWLRLFYLPARHRNPAGSSTLTGQSGPVHPQP